ncbi:MAG: hypothetical protein WBD25_21475 [Terriglobales bacterium]|jgi:hypothetical protein
MTGIIMFHVLMLLLGLSILTRFVPASRVSNMLGYLHKAIGITTPSANHVQMVALIWIGSIIIIADGCLFMLFFIANLSHAR